MTAVEATFGRLAELARCHSFFFSDIWQRSCQQFGPSWVEELVDMIVRLFGREDDNDWEPAIRGYAEFALDAMRNQKHFEKHGQYRWSRLADIQTRYYENEDHMMRNYLPGMFLSHYLWPHHFKLLTFFRRDVLLSLAPSPSLFHDVGIGTGMYSKEVLRAFPGVRGKGFDISKYSVAFTRKVLEAYGVIDRYEFVIGNIFTVQFPGEKADFLVSQEVLEHLEEPRRFCEILFEMLRPGGRAYITAAINAGHSDHIYLFRSPEELKEMLTGVGFRILKGRAEYAYEGQPVEITPCVAGYLCEK